MSNVEPFKLYTIKYGKRLGIPNIKAFRQENGMVITTDIDNVVMYLTPEIGEPVTFTPQEED